MIDPVVFGQILLATVGGVISVATIAAGTLQKRSNAYWKRELEKERTASQIALKDAEAKAQERVLAAEADIRSIANQQAAMANQQIILTQLLELLRDTGKRNDEKDSRVQAVLSQLLDASRESTDTLKIHNQHLIKLVGDLGSVKTDLGEGIRVLTLVEGIVSALPTEFDSRTNPIVDSIKQLMKRIDDAIGDLGAAKEQLILDLVAAIRDVNTDAIQEMVNALTTQSTSLTTNPTEGTS